MVENPVDTTSSRLSRAVWETVSDDGIEATTVRRVAQRAKCTTGLLMHHFGSRKAMLTHAREVLYLRTAARADSADRRTSDPRDKLYEVLSGSLTLDAERRQEARVWMGFAAAALPDSEIRGLHVAGNRDWLRRITRLVSACAPEMATTEAHGSAVRLIAVTEGLASLSSLDPEMYSTEVQRSTLRTEIDALFNCGATESEQGNTR